MWEGEGGRFTPLRGPGCRAIEPADAGKRIVGVAIKPDTLAMHLTPPWKLRLASFARGVLLLATMFGLVAALVRVRTNRLIIPLILVGLSVLVIVANDASFLGAVRPFDGGDDGLFYDGVARLILQKMLAGDFYGALEGGEKVFYYGGPGLRYFRCDRARFLRRELSGLSFAHSALSFSRLRSIPSFLAGKLVARIDHHVHRRSNRCRVRHQLCAIRAMGVTRLRGSGGIHSIHWRRSADGDHGPGEKS